MFDLMFDLTPQISKNDPKCLNVNKDLYFEG